MTPSRITKFSMEQIRYLFVRALIKNVTLSGIKEKMFLQNIMFFRKIFLWEKIYLGHDSTEMVDVPVPKNIIQQELSLF
jgi:hypothetical protein